MKCTILFFAGIDKETREYTKESYVCDFPLKFGFGSFNEDSIIKNIPKKIFVKDIISIDLID
jgi:hypothetical protein